MNVIAILKAVMESHVGDRGHVYDSHPVDCMTLERDTPRVLERVVAFSSVEIRLDCSERGESGQIYHSYNPITVTSHDQRGVSVA